MIEMLKESHDGIVGFVLSGKLHDEDYNRFVPEIERILAREGKIRLLALFRDFHGWDLHAAWDDMAFGVKHVGDVEKIALVGDRKWERWMARLCRPFTRAQVQYYDLHNLEQAWSWVHKEA
jgi:hypothetical protein